MKIGTTPLFRSTNQMLQSITVSVGKKDNKQGTAASMRISKRGREFAQKLRADSVNRTKSYTTLEEKRNRIEELQQLARNGVELTEEDRRFVDEEMQKLASATYVEKRNHLVTKEDVENCLSALKENFEKRLRIYSDMQKEVDESRQADKLSADNVMIAAAKLEEEQEKRIIELLEESLGEEDDEDEVDKTDAEERKEEKENFTVKTSAEEPEEEEQQLNPLVSQAMKIIDANQEAIKEINDQATAQFRDAEEYNRLMDREFLRMSDIIGDKDIPAEDKLYEYKKYQENMQEFSYNKMIAQIKGQFDMETYLVSAIELAGHDDLNDLLLRSQGQDKVKQLQMVMEYLTKA